MKEKQIIDNLGFYLLDKPFREWFRVMFRIIENTPFQMDKIHYPLFDAIENVIALKTKRLIINIPPRAGKTTICIYLIAYSYALNKHSNSIYTSYSKSRVSNSKDELLRILNHPVYKAWYSSFRTEELSDETVNDWWTQYYEETSEVKGKKNKDNKFHFKSDMLVSAEGGKTLFSPLGAAITGFGAGIRTKPNDFCGLIAIDDPNKPSTTKYERMRENVNSYFSGTLISRLNNSNVPIVVIQQRTHFNDFSGYIEENYPNFEILRIPLLEDDGSCNIRSQYTSERLKELQQNQKDWLSQYQQQPTLTDNNIIDWKWFKTFFHYPESFDTKYIVCDTAFSEKTTADYSVLMLWGWKNGNGYILDVKYGNWNYPNLYENLVKLYQSSSATAIYIENKASGQSLIQALRMEKLPIQELYPKAYDTALKKEYVSDKITRYYEIESYLASGLIFLPSSERENNWLREFKRECLLFGTHQAKDDMIDCLIYGIKVKDKINKVIDWSKARKNISNRLKYA